MPKRGTPRAKRHAEIVPVPDGGFAVQCGDCKWIDKETFTARNRAQAAVDMHEVIRHTPKPKA